MFSFALILIIVICLVIIFYTLLKKLPKVAAVNSENAQIVKQSAVKRRLLEERLERKLATGSRQLVSFIIPLWKNARVLLKDLHSKVVQLEEEYRHKVLKSSFKDQVKIQQQTDKLLRQAEDLLSREKDAEAESKYIDVLALDQKNVAAYQGLGQIYMDRKDYEHAKETFEFLLKIGQSDPFVYKNLGAISSERGDLKTAEEQLIRSLELDETDINNYLDLSRVYLNLEENQKALELAIKASSLEPNNPKILDFLIEVSIIMRDKEAASKAFLKLKEVNPENQKLDDLRKKIEEL